MIEGDARAKDCFMTGESCKGDNCQAWIKTGQQPSGEETKHEPFDYEGTCLAIEFMFKVPDMLEDIKLKIERLET